MPTLQEQYDAKRKEYLDGKLTHAEFYLWLADAIHITIGDLPVTLLSIQESKDEHLNDIPLSLWDNKDPIVRRRAASYGMRSWSLSDTVCVLKCFARHLTGTFGPNGGVQ